MGDDVSDQFTVGLKRFFQDHPEVKPATVGVRAGLSQWAISNVLHGKTRSMRHENAVKIATALGLTVDQIAAQNFDGATSPPLELQPSGVAEDACPFTGATPDQAAAVRALFGHAGRNIAITHCATHWLPDLGITTGDLIVCDLSRLPAPGELALVTQSDDNGHSISLIRRYLPPWLVASGPAGATPAQVSDPGIAVRHPVVGIIRAPALAK